MMRLVKIAGLVWLVTANASFGADQKGGTPKPSSRALAPARPKAEGAPKGGRASPPVRVTNPGSLAARLYQMTPEQRERVLEKLPPAQQDRARKTLEAFDKLPKEQQQQRILQAERLASLPPEQEREVRQSVQSFQKLPPERKQAVRQALGRLQNMTPERRDQVVNSEQFKSLFSPDEQTIIHNLSEIVMPPL